MPLDDAPAKQFARLLKKLDATRPIYEELQAYYDGTHCLPITASKRMQEAYRRLVQMSSLNLAELAVEAVRERMKPQGFRTGAQGPAQTDDLGDTEAWAIWQANSLDADIDLLFTPMLSMGASYAIVGEVDEEIGAATVTAEDPRQVTALYDPIRRRKVTAALKVFRDEEENTEAAYLYLPGVIHRLKRYLPASVGEAPITLDVSGWENDGAPQEIPTSVGVPVVPFLDRPDRWYNTKSEIQPHLRILDRIDYQLLNQLEILTMQAFKQRAIKGDLPVKDENGDEIDYQDVFRLDPGSVWELPGTCELWESGTVDISPVRMAIKDDVERFAAVTRTPLYYVAPDSANGSAEGASLAREGLIFRSEDRMGQAGESLELTMSKAFLWAGDTARGSRKDMEVIWKPAERYSLSERADANIKAKAGDVPWETRMTQIMGYSPQETARMKAQRADEQLETAILLANTTPVAPPVP